jgi:hypothetical protein
VLVEEACVQVGGLLAGGCVDGGAEPVEALGDLDRREAPGALEQQVLEEMRDAGLGRRLVPGATERTAGTSSVTTRTPEPSSLRLAPLNC